MKSRPAAHHRGGAVPRPGRIGREEHHRRPNRMHLELEGGDHAEGFPPPPRTPQKRLAVLVLAGGAQGRRRHVTMSTETRLSRLRTVRAAKASRGPPGKGSGPPTPVARNHAARALPVHGSGPRGQSRPTWRHPGPGRAASWDRRGPRFMADRSIRMARRSHDPLPEELWPPGSRTAVSSPFSRGRKLTASMTSAVCRGAIAR